MDNSGQQAAVERDAKQVSDDTARLDWLENLLKQESRSWPLVGIQTIEPTSHVFALNKHHGDEAGLYQAPTLREAIDKARIGKK